MQRANEDKHDNHNQVGDLMDLLNELDLQRLVDNELSHDQVRKLLADIELSGDPSHWKRIALAFTENQLWNVGFLADQAQTDLPLSGEALVSADSAPMNLADWQSVEGGSDATNEAVRGRGVGVWWGIAASILLALATVSMIAGNSGSGNRTAVESTESLELPGSQMASNRIADVDPIDPAESINSFDRTTLASFQPDHQLSSSKLGSNVAVDRQPGRVIPLYDARRLKSEHLADLHGGDLAAREALFNQVLPRGLSPESVKRLQRAGGVIDENIEIISGRLDDGRSYVIPYRTIRFLPGQ